MGLFLAPVTQLSCFGHTAETFKEWNPLFCPQFTGGLFISAALIVAVVSMLAFAARMRIA